MLSVKDIIDRKIDGPVKLKAYFYVLGGTNESAFLADNKDGYTQHIITLPNNIINTVIEQDESFGILVGGKYAYYGMDAVIEGTLAFQDQQPYLSKVDKIVLSNGDLTQSFTLDN